jgi:hypothetical protein
MFTRSRVKYWEIIADTTAEAPYWRSLTDCCETALRTQRANGTAASRVLDFFRSFVTCVKY